MKYKFFYYLPLILLFLISDNIYSQSWRFPDCNDLSVTKIEFIDTQHDTLLVSVYNECDTCYQHVYTGLIAYQNNDTIAIDRELLSRPSPPNNSELDYYLIARNNFEINDIDKIQMIYVCDSLHFSPVLTIDENKNVQLKSSILYQNYPNPFNPTTAIGYQLPDNSHVILRIYNMLGQEVKTLVNAQQKAGSYKTIWNGLNSIGKQVASGVYYYQLFTDKGFSQTKKLLLLR